MRILLVEDDEPLATTVGDALRAAAHQVDHASGGRAALAAAAYDLVVLDLGLPDLDGRDVCRELRRRDADVPIMIVSAAGDEIDRVLGFELGADDYLVKPFSLRELLARVRALGKRAQPGPVKGIDDETTQMIGSSVRIDRRSRQVFLGGREVHLTAKEFDVLSYLAEDVGAVFRREEIFERVWGSQWFGPTKTLDAHIAAVRRKLAGGIVITAVRGVGFRLDAPG